jgi:hypothetical protein
MAARRLREDVIEAWAAQLAASPLSRTLAASTWAYPAANVGHLLGLFAALGSVLVLDLRLLGAGRRLPFAVLSAALSPVIVAGFALAAASGLVMALADPVTLARSPMVAPKFALIALAALNAIAFRRLGPRPHPARAARHALASLLLWAGAVTAGRLIGYL